MVRVVAGLLYRDGRVLLGKRTHTRNSFPGVWDMPGGHCDPGESSEEALKRELEEEIGVQVISATPLTGLAYEEGSTSNVDMNVFLITAWSSEPANLLMEEHQELRWFSVAEACELVLASDAYPALLRQAEGVVEGQA